MNRMLSLKKYNWIQAKEIFVTGFTWFGNEYCTGIKFLDLFDRHLSDFDAFKNIICQLNGQFSVVVKKEDQIWATCSHTWSYPLFYKQTDTEIFLSDNPETLQQSDIDKEFDLFTSSYFKVFGVTPFNQTLSKTIFQLRPGEVICLTKSKPDPVSEFHFILKQEDTFSPNTKEVYSQLTAIFEKYFEAIKNKQVLLPLTGGYDSRLLACLLSEFGHKNVLCATWGRKDNSEKQTAERVAKALGFPYQFIEYNKELIKDFDKEEGFPAYVQHAAHWSSMPYLQDYFAVKYLKENNIIGDGTVAVPGHPGDFVRGTHLNDHVMQLSSENLAAALLSNLGTSFPVQKQTKNELQTCLEQMLLQDSLPAWKSFEIWDYEERQCKFIGNSNHVFSWFGIDYMMPLFDKDVLNFFQGISLEGGEREKLYNQTLEEHFFKPHGVDFALKLARLQKPKQWGGMKRKLIEWAPNFLKVLYYPMKDTIFYREITKVFRDEYPLKHPVKPTAFNAYIVQWYLQFLSLKDN